MSDDDKQQYNVRNPKHHWGGRPIIGSYKGLPYTWDAFINWSIRVSVEENEVKPLLAIFDIDGTLAPFGLDKPYTDVLPFFEEAHAQMQIRLITNQGGVALRAWMESGGWGEPEKYPTEEQARAHMDGINNALPGGPYPVHVCFAYQTKKGKWAPNPDGSNPEHTDDHKWAASHRKPNPGMILDAIREAGVSRARTVYIGDGPEDEACARNAGVLFIRSDAFFNSYNAERDPFVGKEKQS